MSWLRRIFARFEARVRNWFNRPYRTMVVKESLPKWLERRTLYIVREDGFSEQAAILCPCGCGRTLHMNLLPDERPCWSFTLHDDGTGSLHPSVWRKTDCRSHFWFRRGRVQWAVSGNSSSHDRAKATSGPVS